MDSLSDRAVAAVEDSFRKNVREDAIAVWARVSGGQPIDSAMVSFNAALVQIKELRERQLQEVAKVFGGDS